MKRRSFWPTWLRSSAPRRPARLQLTPLEDRVTPAVTATVDASKVLTIAYDGFDANTYLQVNTGTMKVDVTADDGAGGPITVLGNFDIANVNRIVATTTDTSKTQKIAFSGATKFTLTSGVSIADLDDVTLGAPIDATGSSFSVVGAAALHVSAPLTAGTTASFTASAIDFTATGKITGSAATTFVADNMTIAAGAAISSTGTTTFTTSSTTVSLDLGGADSASVLGLTALELAAVTSPSIAFLSKAAITVSETLSLSSTSPLVLRTLLGGTITVNAGKTLTASNDLLVETTDIVTPGQNITINGTLTSTAGNVEITSGDLVTIAGTVNAKAGKITVTSDDSLTINATGVLSAKQDLTLKTVETAATQDITINGSLTSSAGNVDVTSGDGVTIGGTATATIGKLTVTAEDGITLNTGSILSAKQEVALKTSDSATTQNISIAGSVTSTNSTVSIASGDDLTISGTVSAKGAVTLAIDAVSVDTAGAIATITGQISGASASLVGNTGDDTFKVIAQPVALAVNGVSGNDSIIFDAQNQALSRKSTSATSGTFRIRNAKTVTYSNIDLIGTSAVNVGGTLVEGSGLDDDVRIRNNGGLEFSVDAGLNYFPLTGPKFEFIGDDGNDTLTVDVSGGAVVLTGGIFFDGEAGTDDKLRIIGDKTSSIVTYTADNTQDNKGTVLARFNAADTGVSVKFENLDPVDVDGALTFTFNTLGDADDLQINPGKLFGDNTKDAIRISGTTGVALTVIETVAVRNVGTLTVDTTTNEVTSKADSVTIGALTAASNVTNLSIKTTASVGTGTDSVTITNAPNVPGNFDLFTNAITVTGVSMTTGGSQTYSAKTLTLTASPTFTSTNNLDITVNAAITGVGKDLTFVTAGKTTLNGNVNVANLSTSGSGSTLLTGSVDPSTFAGSVSLVFGDNVTIGQNATLTAPTVTFNGKVDDTVAGTHTLTINATGDTTFSGVVGTTKLSKLVTDGPGTTNVLASISASSLIEFGDDVVVTNDPTFAATDVTFKKKLDGSVADKEAVLVNATNTIFGDVVGTTRLESLTTNLGAGTTKVGGDVKASSFILFNDAVTLTKDATFRAPNVTFGSTLAGGFKATVDASTKAKFVGVVGTTPNELVELVTTAAGTTEVGASISATSKIFFGNAVMLTGNATFTAPAVTFNKTLDGNFNATVTADTTLFNDDVGSTAPGLASLKTTKATGTTTFNSNTINATTQQFDDSVKVSKSATFTGTTVIFNGTLNDSDGTHDISVNATDTTFKGVVGANKAPVNLTTNAGAGTTKVGANISASAKITFNDAVLLTGNATFESPLVTFNSTLDGGFVATVKASDTAKFVGVVGSTPLAQLIVDPVGKTEVTTNVTANTKIEFGNAVTLFGDANFKAGIVTFQKTLDGNFAVEVNADTTLFNDNVGKLMQLTSLKTTKATGTTTFNSNFIEAKTQEFSDSVIVSKNAAFNGTTVTFKGTLQSLTNETFSVVVNAVTTTFAKAVGGGGKALLSLLTDGPGGTIFVGDNITAKTSIFFADDVVLTGTTSNITAEAVTFNVKLDSNVDGTSGAIINAKDTLFVGDVGSKLALGSGLTLLKTDSNGITTFKGSTVKAVVQEYDDAVEVANDITFTGTTSVKFDGTLDASAAFVDITVTSPATTFTQIVGGGATKLQSLTTDPVGITTVNANISAVTLIQFGDAVELSANAVFTAANVDFNSTLSKQFNATINATTEAKFNGNVNVRNLDTTGSGSTNLSGPGPLTTFIASDDIAFGVNVVLSQNAAVTADNVSFKGTVNGGKSLTIDADTTKFNDNVGNLNPLTTLATTRVTGTTTFSSNVINATTQQFNDSVKVSKAAVFTGTTVTFNGTLNDNTVDTNKVTVNAVTTTFSKAVGGTTRLMALETDLAGITAINGGSVQTKSDQIYNDDVVIGTNTTFASESGKLSFLKSLLPATAGLNVTLSTAGDIILNGPTGDTGSKRLGTVTVSNANNVTAGDIGAASLVQTTGTGTTQLNGRVNVSSPAGVSLSTSKIGIANDVTSPAGGVTLSTTGGVLQTAGAVSSPTINVIGAMNQTGGTLLASKLILSGSGVVSLNQAGNDFQTLATTGSGDVTVRDINDLSITDAEKVFRTNSNVTLNVGTNFRVVDLTSTERDTVVINLGTGAFTANVGQNVGDPKVITFTTFDAEIQASGAKLSGFGGSDSFDIRPSKLTEFAIYGGTPVVPPVLPPNVAGDALLPIYRGAVSSNFNYDGQNGVFEFANGNATTDRRKIVFFGIDSLKKVDFAATAVLISEPGDGSNNTQQPIYTVRVGVSQSNNKLPSNLSGTGVPQNAFAVSPSRIDPFSPFTAPQLALAKVNSDGIPDLVIANGPGTGSTVTVIDGRQLSKGNTAVALNTLTTDTNGGILEQFYPYDAKFTGGINVAATTFVKDGVTKSYIVTGPGVGGGPQVRVFSIDRNTGRIIPTNIYSFFAFDNNVRSGVRVSIGDVIGSGTPDIVVSSGPGAGPRVRVFDGDQAFTGSLGKVTYIENGRVVELTSASQRDFFAYGSSFMGGVYIDVGNYDGAGKEEILVGAGIGGGPHIAIYDVSTAKAKYTPIYSFFADFGTAQNNPLFGSTQNLGVGGVAFAAGSTPGRLDVVVTSPRGLKTAVKQFNIVGFPAKPVALDFFTINEVPAVPEANLVLYGASVGSFEAQG